MTTTSSTTGSTSKPSGAQPKDSAERSAHKTLAESYISYLEYSVTQSQTISAALTEQGRAAAGTAFDLARQLTTTLVDASSDYVKRTQELGISTVKAVAEAAEEAGAFTTPSLIPFAPLSDTSWADFIGGTTQTGKQLTSASVTASKEILSAQRQVAEQAIGAVSRWWN